MKNAAGKNCWLFKQEPSCYSYSDLERDGRTTWDGVANAQARLYLRQVQVGDRVLFYHTGSEKAIVGEMRVVSGPQAPESDPKAVLVDVVPVRRWEREVSLAEIKAEPTLASWHLVRSSRLSVMPVSPEQLQMIETLARRSLADA